MKPPKIHYALEIPDPRGYDFGTTACGGPAEPFLYTQNKSGKAWFEFTDWFDALEFYRRDTAPAPAQATDMFTLFFGKAR